MTTARPRQNDEDVMHPDEESRACMSAFADGEAASAQAACAAWRENPAARSHWHAVHLIGDVLRSDELASPSAHDAAFLDGVRARLAQEPVPLSPAPLKPAPAPLRRRQAWLAPMAVAAGFVAVAGVLVVSRLSLPGAADSTPTLAAAPAAGITVVSENPQGVQAGLRVDGDMIRDPRLDNYLRAHREMRGGAMRRVDVPAGATR